MVWSCKKTPLKGKMNIFDIKEICDDSTRGKQNVLVADYENYVVNDIRDVHVFSQSQLAKFVDKVSYSEKSDKKIKAKTVLGHTERSYRSSQLLVKKNYEVCYGGSR